MSFLELPYTALLNDRDGQLLSARIAADGQWRFPISPVKSGEFEKAILTYEDQRFYLHPGVDPLSLLRAIYQNLKEGSIVSGASTLTMQLARLSKGQSSRNIYNKIIEINLAIRFELWHSKKEILSWYASLAPYGGNVVGLEAACWRYFNKSSNQLTWAEAAMLAVLPNAPSLIHVNKNREQLQIKRDFLLKKLHQKKHIDDLDLEAALAEPLPSTVYSLPNAAPHFLEYLKRSSGDEVYSSDLQKDIQIQAGQVLNEFYSIWKANKISNGGAVILETKTGKLVAYHGNIPNTSEESWVDVVRAARSSGSILKPLLYAHQLNEGLISPSQLMADIPTYISGFNPTNYHKTYSGAVPADEALQRSLNVPAVRQLQKYGVEKFLIQLRAHGFTTFKKHADHYGLSLILGGGEVSLWELAHVYQQLGGQLVNTHADTKLSNGAVFQTFEALKGLSRPDEAGNWQVMDSRFPVAWKTGTSYGHRDAWAVGVTPAYTIATWVGNADGEGRDGIIGAATAGKLLFSLFDILSQDEYWFTPPYEEMSYFNICSASGYLLGSNCPDTLHLYLPNNIERAPVCPHHSKYFTNLDASFRVDPSCVGKGQMKQTVYFELSPEIASYYIPSHPEYMRPPPMDPDCMQGQSIDEIAFTYPMENEIIYLPADLNNRQQELVARIATLQQDQKLFWYLDETYLGATEVFHTMSLRPGPGNHTLLAMDISGNRISRRFKVASRLHP